MFPKSSSERIVIVGGGFAGLACATQLSQAGFPVTLIEASQLGYAASSKNQGWLHSGASIARVNPSLAGQCYKSLQQTLIFCPECIEPDIGPMIYGSLDQPSDLQEWTKAWKAAGIPSEELLESEFHWEMPQIDRERLTWLFKLPDRSFRPEILLKTLANAARESGVEIRSGTFVSNLLIDEQQVRGVRVGESEEIYAQLVILAIGTANGRMFSTLNPTRSGQQNDFELAYLKTHLIAVSPVSSVNAFHLTGTLGFNHLPHLNSSVYGTNRWKLVKDPNDVSVDPDEIRIIEERVSQVMPSAIEQAQERKEWAGVTVQAMHVEEVDPAQAFRPTVIDHAQQPHGVENVISVFPGRATLWAELAAKVEGIVCDKTKKSPTVTTVPPWAQMKS